MKTGLWFATIRDYMAANKPLFEFLTKLYPDFVNLVLAAGDRSDLLDRILLMSAETKRVAERLEELATAVPATGDPKQELQALMSLLMDEPEDATASDPRELIQ